MAYKFAAALEAAVKGLPDPERLCSAARAGSEKNGTGPSQNVEFGRGQAARGHLLIIVSIVADELPSTRQSAMRAESVYLIGRFASALTCTT